MTKFYFADVMPDGLVRACFTYTAPEIGPPVDGVPDPQLDSQVEGAIVALDAPINWAGPTPTSVLHMVDGALAWRETASLDEVKARKWDEVKAARANAEAGSFTYDGGAYQVNVAQVTGAVTMAMLARAAGKPYSIVWTLTDNSRRTLDGDQMTALGVAMGAYVDGIYATARALRDQVDAAATIEAVEAIAWPA